MLDCSNNCNPANSLYSKNHNHYPEENQERRLNVEWQKALLYIGIGAIFVLSCFLCYCAGDNNKSKDLERLEQQAAEYRATIAKLTDSITDLNSRLASIAKQYSDIIDSLREIKEGSGRLTEDLQRSAELNSGIIEAIRGLREDSERYIKEASAGNTTIPNRNHNLRKHKSS